MALESGTEKVKEICKIIKEETLQPAKDEAQQIVNEAHAEADLIIKKASEDADDILKSLKKELEKTQNVSNASIELAIKQGVAKLKQLSTSLFTDELQKMAFETMTKDDVMVKVVDSLVNAIQKDGTDINVRLVLAKNTDKDDFIKKLAVRVREKLEKEPIAFGDQAAGVVVKVIDKKIAFEITDKAIVQLLSTHLSEELREKLFCHTE